MPDTPEFKLKLEIHHKGGKDGTRHLLAALAMLCVLFALVAFLVALAWRIFPWLIAL